MTGKSFDKKPPRALQDLARFKKDRRGENDASVRIFEEGYAAIW